MFDDTIAAISTPLGEGGIGIIRISGAKARDILERVFKRPKGRGFPPRRIAYGHVVDPDTGAIVDEALASYMPAPYTYTREDVAEINCHGGPLALQRALGVALAAGARLANPGEFTLRAFLNGRIDLAQAESVMDIIQAKTAASLHLAVDQLHGRLSTQVQQIRRQLVSTLAYLTAIIDFVDDEIPEQDVVGPLQIAQARLRALLEDADAGVVYRQGVRTAIVGRPNVGKSSLMNALLDEDRAIVTPVPGTTRDTLEEVLNLKGIPLILVDTAGITHTHDEVERLGVERSRRAIERANLVIMVVDGSEPLQDRDREIAALVGGRPTIVVVNKSDLPSASEDSEVETLLPGAPLVNTSTKTLAGLDDLEKTIVALALGGRVVTSDALLVSNPRHQDALRRAERHVEAALEGQQDGRSADLVCIDLTSAVNALGEITGETVGEELLETIFSSFCIGK